jgi:hypothetical protein
MKKLISFAAVFLAVFLLCSAGIYKADFLGTAVSCGTSTTLTNGTDFTSASIWVSQRKAEPAGTIIVTFTRVTGSASKVYFDFQMSYDDGTTWSTAYFIRIEVATNELAVSNTVRFPELVSFYGCTHLRLYRIINNDAAVALTLCSATLMMRVND